MTTREIYFKSLILADMPSGLVGYVIQDANGIIQIGNSIPLKFSTDINIVENAIEEMKVIEKKEGFMFWNNSPEGEKFFDEINWTSLGKELLNKMLDE